MLGISATAPGRLLMNHCAVAGWGDGKGPGPACQTEPALQENIPCKLLRLLPGRNGTVRARGFCPGVEESSERAVQKDGQGTIGQRDNAACSAHRAALRHTPRPHPLPAALAPRTQRCLLPSAGTQICHLVSSARPQNPARHPHSFAPRRIALPAAFQVAVLRAGARVRLARRIWHAGALLKGDSPIIGM